MKLSHDELKGLMKNKLMQAGLKADHADMTADVLTWSDERGYHSHGAACGVLQREDCQRGRHHG